MLTGSLREASGSLRELTGWSGEGAEFASWALLGPLGPSWVLLGASWAILGASWVLLGNSWALLGNSWLPLGCLSGPLDNLLAASWVLVAIPTAVPMQIRRTIHAAKLFLDLTGPLTGSLRDARSALSRRVGHQ